MPVVCSARLGGGRRGFFRAAPGGQTARVVELDDRPSNLADAVKTLGIRRVITSKKLIDRLGIQIGGTNTCFWKT